MVIFSEILYWSLLRSFSFRESLFFMDVIFMDVMMISLVGK